jgi:hypothetical protein
MHHSVFVYLKAKLIAADKSIIDIDEIIADFTANGDSYA